MTDPAEVVDASSRVFAELNQRVPGFDGLVAPDITVASIGLPVARVNSASAARFSAATVDARIDDVVAWFEERQVPFVWRLGPSDQPINLGDRLLAKGFTLDPDEMPGMAAPLVDLPAVELPAGTVIEVVRDAIAFREWLDTMVAGFGMPPKIGDAYMAFATLGFGDDLPTRGLLVRVEGRPVATALGVLAGKGIVIVNVATVPDERGRGIGRAVTLAAMHLGAEAGAQVAVLQSTEMGHGVYRRLGFEEYGRYRVLARLPG
ncbi:MAG: GNAT family N-acetyltransferase [Chloroflexota bacterium]